MSNEIICMSIEYGMGMVGLGCMVAGLTKLCTMRKTWNGKSMVTHICNTSEMRQLRVHTVTAQRARAMKSSR